MTHIIQLTAEQEMDFLISWATQSIALCVSVAPKLQEDGELAAHQAPDTGHGSAVAIEL